MKTAIYYLILLHILAGTMALISGLVAISSAKGQATHLNAGKVYAISMSLVFVSGIIIAGYRSNEFLFLIAFLSYYSVYSGIRILKLKNLHIDQQAKWFDWMAGIVNAAANIVFIGLGIHFGLTKGFASGGALLSIGFGVGGLSLSFLNLYPFLKRPQNAYHWYLTHIANMMGAYIATLTAFLSTIVTRYEIMNPYLAFALPSALGIPLLFYWQKKIERSFASK